MTKSALDLSKRQQIQAAKHLEMTSISEEQMTINLGSVFIHAFSGPYRVQTPMGVIDLKEGSVALIELTNDHLSKDQMVRLAGWVYSNRLPHEQLGKGDSPNGSKPWAQLQSAVWFLIKRGNQGN